jgi:hypothetical protein
MAFALGACSGSIGPAERPGDDGTGPGDTPATMMHKDPNGPTPPGGGAGGAMSNPVMAPPSDVGTSPLAPDRSTAACKDVSPGPAPVRRLTRVEFDNTVKDLVGQDMHLAADFPPEEVHAGFDNDAVTRSVSDLLAEGYQAAAEKISKAVLGQLGTILPCATGGDEAACLDQFFDGLGKRIWRRPLTDDERADLKAVFTAGRTTAFGDGLDAVVQVMVLSPQFLYRVETGVAAQAGRLTPWEMASRLSYLIVGSMPDAPLFAAADAGELATREQVAAQAERLLKDARGTAMFVNFSEQWLQIRALSDSSKDPMAYPKYKDTFLTSWQGETDGFVSAVWNGDAKLDTLLTAPWSMLNAELASLYGVSGPQGAAFEKVAMDPKQRAGVLTQGSIMAVQSDPDQTSPIHRGVFVLNQMLCSPPAPPPVEVNAQPPALDPKMTTRERVAAHRTNPSCAACHDIIDNVGLGFENYDALGAYRSTENGKPVDATGALMGTDVDKPFNGAVELAQLLASSKQVDACMTDHWFHFGLGRDPVMADACTQATLAKVFDSSGGDLRQLLLAIVQSDAFFFKGGLQ